MGIGDDFSRQLELSNMQFSGLRRLGILIFTTILVMWYLLTMLGYVIEAYKTGVSSIPVRGSTLAAILVSPVILNFTAWTAYLFTTRREEIYRSEYSQYDGPQAPPRFRPWGQLVDFLAIGQILYLWLSLSYIVFFAAETISVVR